MKKKTQLDSHGSADDVVGTIGQLCKSQPDNTTARPWRVSEFRKQSIVGMDLYEVVSCTIAPDAALIVKAVNTHAAHEALAKFVGEEVLRMLELCGYGGKNRRTEDSHIRQIKKRLEAINGKAVQS